MSYPIDSTLRRRVLDLLRSVWPAIPPAIERARRWGSDWFDVSTPFVVWDGGRVVAHAGVVLPQLWLDGARREVAAVHAVCVASSHRGSGLGRRVMEQALAHVDRQGHASCILWSEKSDFYRRFGFSPRSEPWFVGPAPEGIGPAGTKLDVTDPRDLGRLRDALACRSPVSDRAAAADAGWHFLIDLSLWAEAASLLWWLEEEAVVVVAESKDDELHLYDIVGPALPDPARVVGAVGAQAGRCVVHFTPDRFAPALPPDFERGERELHVRGEPLLDAAGGPFTLSPLVRT